MCQYTRMARTKSSAWFLWHNFARCAHTGILRAFWVWRLAMSTIRSLNFGYFLSAEKSTPHLAPLVNITYMRDFRKSTFPDVIYEISLKRKKFVHLLRRYRESRQPNWRMHYTHSFITRCTILIEYILSICLLLSQQTNCNDLQRVKMFVMISPELWFTIFLKKKSEPFLTSIQKAGLCPSLS